MINMDTGIILLLMTVLIIATVIDMRTMRIPNSLSFFLICAGLGLTTWSAGWKALFLHLLAVILYLVIFLIPYALKMLGAGDVKLIAATGAVLGMQDVLFHSLMIFFFGIFFSVFYIWKQNGFQYVRSLFRSVYYAFVTRNVKEETQRIKRKEQVIVPYSLAILFGTVVVVWRTL